MAIKIGSARQDERGKLTGGTAGDQNGKEVSEQPFYVHKKGWYILRPKSIEHAMGIAERMHTACNNPNLGYDQNNRGGVLKYGIDTKTKTECDCSALVRACVKEATGKDPGNFTTSNEVAVLSATGLFEKPVAYTSKSIICTGDILVTKTKGHTVICTAGAVRVPEQPKSYYPAYKGYSISIVDALKAVGENDTTKAHRAQIAKANGISGYSGSLTQNNKLMKLLKNGKLVRG